jgi:hypothetical protein
MTEILNNRQDSKEEERQEVFQESIRKLDKKIREQGQNDREISSTKRKPFEGNSQDNVPLKADISTLLLHMKQLSLQFT